MEADFLIQKSKKQKLNEEPDVDGNTKCLGSLPEVVLRHILSFLPSPKDAVRTSVLSNMWEYLWTSLPNVQFEQSLYITTSKPFMNFVERVLCLHVADVTQFSLFCPGSFDASHVGAWVTAAVRKNVRELELRFLNLKGCFHGLVACFLVRH